MELYTEFERNKAEIGHEFCTLLAVLLIVMLLVIVVMAFKADQIFCHSNDIDMINTEL